MLRFQHPEHFYALLLLPVVWLLLVWMAVWRSSARRRAGDAIVVRRWLGSASYAFVGSGVALSLVIGLVAIAWAGPYRPAPPGAKREKTRGHDVIIALDVSKSMLARDIGPDRLSAARAFIADLANRLETDRIGLLLFAGRAYLQTPLTTDRSALLTVLPGIGPESASSGGTAIAEAFRIAVQAFPESAPTGRILVLISDGEDHGGNALDAATKAAKEARFTIHAVGIGSPEGATLFDPKTGAPRTDGEGQPIVTKLDEEGLRQMAAQNGGRYVRMQSPEAASQAIAAAISPTAGNLGKVNEDGDGEQLFQIALLPAFALLALTMLLSAMGRKNVVRAAAVVLIFLLSAPQYLAAQERQLRIGNELYREGRYREADEVYGRVLSADSTNSLGRFNRGAAQYQQKNWDAARKSMNAAASVARDAATKSAALYNTGNAYGAEQNWKKAVEAYKLALRARPGDADAQYNLSYAMKKLRAQQEQEKNKKKDPQQDKKQQQDPKDDEKKNEKSKQQTNAMSKDGAEKILSALREDEKHVREREQEEMNRSSAKPEKDW